MHLQEHEAFIFLIAIFIVISIPILILRQVQIKFFAKLLLSCSLCLSAMMIVVAIIGVSRLHDTKANAIDGVWAVYWQWVEVCMAITMASFTVFRTFFVQHTQRHRAPPRRVWYSNIWARIRSNTSPEEEASRAWPTIPKSIMTGMRSFIDRHGHESEEEDSEEAQRPSRLQMSQELSQSSEV